MADDFFIKEFDDTTQAKLSLFRANLKGWLPVFVKRRKTIKKTKGN